VRLILILGRDPVFRSAATPWASRREASREGRTSALRFGFALQSGVCAKNTSGEGRGRPELEWGRGGRSCEALVLAGRFS